MSALWRNHAASASDRCTGFLRDHSSTGCESDRPVSGSMTKVSSLRRTFVGMRKQMIVDQAGEDRRFEGGPAHCLTFLLNRFTSSGWIPQWLRAGSGIA